MMSTFDEPPQIIQFVDQDVSEFARDWGTVLRKRDSDIRRFERDAVIDSVTDHPNAMTALL